MSTYCPSSTGGRALAASLGGLTLAIALSVSPGSAEAQGTGRAGNNPPAATPDLPQGERIDVGGFKLNSVHVPRPKGADLPPLVFIHGASTSLLDPYGAFRTPLDGRAEMLFVDRPGLGFSDAGGSRNRFPDGQADAIATLMQKRGIRRAIIVSHSFGGAIAATFALRHKEMVAGLVFLSPATHPWPGGIEWYYSVAKSPVIGPLFTALVVPPVGLLSIDKATRAVFAPNPRPDDYIEKTRARLALRPGAFRNNATDIANLLGYVREVAPRYREITAPTVIITGDRDGVVLPEIHSVGLHKAISGSRLIRIHNLGHKPDYVVTDVAIAAIETVAGRHPDLDGIARRAERRLAKDDAK
ncbi:alpha/beta fold hydrolase [Rhizobium rhizosphaerae]|uniref:alpha/beta fold hydrolase n=1 Tax=Xaviernesmea rhizosphaerae TaxID=1672749 RepID=UPI001FD91D79|nr:alpha/beta hydrolase [Xaviernesmea rhizosphaerae]